MNCKREQRRSASVDTEPTPLHPGAQRAAGRRPRPAGTETGNAPPSAAPQNAPRARAATKPQGQQSEKHIYRPHQDGNDKVGNDQHEGGSNGVCSHSEIALSLFSKIASKTGTVIGLSIPSGHSAASGQFSENQRIARSKVPVARSPPSAMSSIFAPRLKTSVESRFRPMPTAAA